MATVLATSCQSGSIMQKPCSAWIRETLATTRRALRKQSERLTKLAEGDTQEILSREEDASWTTACEFAWHRIDPRSFIYASQHSFCVLTRRPVARGHGIVCPRRPVKALFDLPKEEADDLFLAVQLVSWILTSFCGSTATTVTLQQGEGAHQRLPHLFFHVVPRKADDFPCNDYIYKLLDERSPIFDTVTAGTEADCLRYSTRYEGASCLAECHTDRVKDALPISQAGPTAHTARHSAGLADKCKIEAVPCAEIEQQSREIRKWLLNLDIDEEHA